MAVEELAVKTKLDDSSCHVFKSRCIPPGRLTERRGQSGLPPFAEQANGLGLFFLRMGGNQDLEI